MNREPKDWPVIFSAPMIQALLAGNKTMTRRMLYSLRKIKGDKIPASVAVLTVIENGRQCVISPPTNYAADQYWALTHWHKVEPGDRLWTREACAMRVTDGKPDHNPRYVKYRADHGDKPPRDPMDWHTYPMIWTPAIHMLRKHSRITLTVTEKKIEPIQAITDNDANREGIVRIGRSLTLDGRMDGCGLAGTPPADAHPTYRGAFEWLWRSLHGPDGWTHNPPVVAIGFTMQQHNIDRMPKAA